MKTWQEQANAAFIEATSERKRATRSRMARERENMAYVNRKADEMLVILDALRAEAITDRQAVTMFTNILEDIETETKR